MAPVHGANIVVVHVVGSGGMWLAPAGIYPIDLEGLIRSLLSNLVALYHGDVQLQILR